MINLSQIFEEIENLDKKKIMELLSISIDTSVPPGNSYRKYIDAISPYFKDLEYNLEEVTIKEELINKIPFPLEGAGSNTHGVNESIRLKDRKNL